MRVGRAATKDAGPLGCPSPKPRLILFNALEILPPFQDCELFGDALRGYRYPQIIGLRAVARSDGTPRREWGSERVSCGARVRW